MEKRSRAGRLALGAALAWFTLAFFPPPLSGVEGFGLDSDWRLALNLARARGLVLGSDLVFSSGPLGYLRFPAGMCRDPGSVLVYSIVSYGSLVAALALLVTSLETGAGLWVIAIFAGALLLEVDRSDGLEHAMLALALLPHAARRRWRRLELGWLGVLAGAAALTKLDTAASAVLLFLAAGARVASMDRDDPAERSSTPRRRLEIATALALLSLPVSTAVLFAATSQGLRGLPAFLSSASEILRGYGPAMSKSGPTWELGLALASLGFLLVLPFLCGEARRLLPALVPAGLLAATMYKHAMVRQDAGHSSPLQPWLALYALFLLAAAATRRGRACVAAFQGMALVIGGAIVLTRFPLQAGRIERRVLLETGPRNVRDLLLWNRTWRASAEVTSRVVLNPRIRERIGDGATDAVPWGVALVAGNGLNWRPRPILQDYCAYTPALDAADARHVNGASAAPWLLLRWRYEDDHHPFWETPLLWRAILDWYEPVDADRDVVLLSRRAEPRFAPPESARAATVGWGQELALPAVDGILVTSARIRPSWYGRACALVVRHPPVHVRATMPDGKQASCRVVVANLPSGAIVSGLPLTVGDLARCFEPGRPMVQPVVSLRFDTPDPRRFRPVIDIGFSVLRPRASPGSR